MRLSFRGSFLSIVGGGKDFVGKDRDKELWLVRGSPGAFSESP